MTTAADREKARNLLFPELAHQTADYLARLQFSDEAQGQLERIATALGRATPTGKTRAPERHGVVVGKSSDCRCVAQSEWVVIAGQVSLLLAEIEAGRMTASPAEQVALRTFVATVEGMTNGA